MLRRSAAMNDRRGGIPASLGSRIPLASLIQTLAVAEYLSFYRAAQALGTSQSGVSARIRALEEELGILLFERNTRGVRLTEAGRLFVERVSAGVEQLDHAVKTAGMAASGERGRLRIGIHALIPRSFLAKLIGQYREDHPGIEVEIVEGTAREEVMQLRAGRLDVAFVAGSPALPDCHSRPIWTEPLLAVLPTRHPLAAQPSVHGPSWRERRSLSATAALARRSTSISCSALSGTGPHRRSSASTWVAAPCFRWWDRASE